MMQPRFIQKMKSMFIKRIEKKIKITTGLVFFALLFFLSGAHFHKDQIWPFGHGYYKVFKGIKKYGLGYKQEIAEEARIAEEAKPVMTSVQVLKIDRLRENFDHLAILDENGKKTVNLVAVSGLSTATTKTDLEVYIINLDLSSFRLEKKLIYKDVDNHRVTDVLVTSTKDVIISHVVSDERGYGSLEVFRLKKIKKFEKDLIFRTGYVEPPFGAHQSGGKMITYGPDHLLLAIGDFQKSYLVSDNKYKLGSTVLVDLRNKNQEAQVFSRGHRNIQGLVFDEMSNTIIGTEHGPEGGDEINLIHQGKNYGWPNVTYGKIYEESNPQASYTNPSKELFANSNVRFGNHDGYEKPIHAFMPSIGIKAIEKFPLEEYEFPAWRNNFLVCSTHGILRLVFSNNNSRLILVEKLGIYKSFNQQRLRIDEIEGCRDLVITSSGKIITNDFRIISRFKEFHG